MNNNIFLIIICVILLGAGGFWVIQKANSSYELTIIKKVPTFSFITQDSLSFTEKNFHRRATVLNFIFTSCAGPCPIMTNNMMHLYEDYKHVSEVQFVSITVDPKIDNTSTLKEYAKANGVKDDRWQFLTSDIEAIKDLKKNGFMLYADELPRGHAIKFVLIDQSGQIRKFYDGTDKASISVLRKDLKNIVNEIQS